MLVLFLEKGENMVDSKIQSDFETFLLLVKLVIYYPSDNQNFLNNISAY